MNPRKEKLSSVSTRLCKEERNSIHTGLRVKLGIKGGVWTDRMLTALVNGVKGGKWFSLKDKVCNSENIHQAWLAVAKNRGRAGVDKLDIGMVAVRLEKFMTSLKRRLSEGTYVPQPIMRVYIPKGPGSNEKRGLGIPVVLDRVVQAAIKQVIEPIFEQEFEDTSFGFRPGRGCMGALRKVQENLNEGFHWVVDADLRSYFDRIPHDKLLSRVKEKIADGEVLQWIEAFLKAGILEGKTMWTPDQGTPQGGVLSPLLANIYLHPLDKMMREKGIRMVRYADDFVIMCRSEEEAKRALGLVQEWVEENQLTLHPEKTRLGNCLIKGEGFEFLGYRFESGERRVRKKSLKKLKDTIRGYTRRSSGRSLERIIECLNRSLRGWFNYFKYAHAWTFNTIDGWIRRRLRSILKKRLKESRCHGKTLNDHMRWPNAYFADAGLFSLHEAYKSFIKPIRQH